MIRRFRSLLLVFIFLAQNCFGEGAARYEVEESWQIGKVPSGFPVNFCLLTDNTRQYVAYYDAGRRMTVASRALDSDNWEYRTLPTRVGWDSHNYITMALDREGHLHVSGNLHVNPLIYFKTRTAGDIQTLQKWDMVGSLENRVTYPKFMEDHEGNLLFTYRHGSSGNGIQIWNRYNLSSQSWSRLLDQPLLDGEGKVNAYPASPIRGPDGAFHMTWVWRHSPDCATNHNLSYARSKDMKHWESAFGKNLDLPMTPNQVATWVDPIPSGGGIINGGHRLFFDEQARPIVTYHKSDERGNMQIYTARPEGSEWKIRALTDWDKPVPFSGRGSMGFIGISISNLERVAPGLLTMTYRHKDYGSGRLFIDEASLTPSEKRVTIPPELPKQLDRIHSDFEGMGVRRTWDIGSSDDPSVRYLLQWETLGRNYDRPRKPPLPEPSQLRLYKLRGD